MNTAYNELSAMTGLCKRHWVHTSFEATGMLVQVRIARVTELNNSFTMYHMVNKVCHLALTATGMYNPR